MTQVGCDKVIVAMSGGVDSSVAAWLLQQQGYEVIGVLMRIGVEPPHEPAQGRRQGCCTAADAAEARTVAGSLGIRLYVVNFQEQFEAMIEEFAQEYARGRTPNPCILCNERFKFGRLARYGEALGARFVATGHYARVVGCNGGRALARAVDLTKDQSYVLFSLPRAMLDRVLFPIGQLRKSDVRRCARELGLAVHDKPDSQEICFVPDNDYTRLVRQRCPEAFRPGSLQHTDGRTLGRHEGLGNYTIGQRRGLGVALGSPLYVTKLDPASNTVTVGPREALLHRGLVARGLNWLCEPPAGPLAVRAKIRYTHEPTAASLEVVGPGAVRLMFDEPQAAITPGQAVVFYRGEVVVGGGWIDSWFDA